MALFGLKKNEVVTTTKIRPTVIRTQSVSKELSNLAKSYGIKVETLDFNLLEVQTFTRTNDGTKESDWTEITEDELYTLNDEKKIFNPHFQIKQMYEIEIFSKSDKEDLYKDFNFSIGANSTKCKIYISVKAGSILLYNENISRDLVTLINKRKIKAGVLVYIFDEVMDEAISKIYATTKVEGSLKYAKSETILISEGYEPTLTTDDALIVYYEKKENVDEHHKVDYSLRNFIKSVYKDEVLIEYIKPKDGKAGRNCLGKYLAPKDPVCANEPTFSIDETIKEVDTQDSIKYIARENGYIQFKDNIYSIKTDVDVKEVTFKSTGSIESGIDSDVVINVKEKDAVKDAVGSGMIIEVSEIEVDGNVGSNAKVHAKIAKVGGQTHKSAEIRADKLDINIHKGKAYGKDVHINRLEHGIVECDELYIDQAMGGDIKANEIQINVCTSHVKATATRLIEIKKMQGSENSFIIDPLIRKDLQKSFSKNNEDIITMKHDLRELKKEVDKYSKLVKANSATFNDVKKRLLNYKKNGIKMPEAFVKKYKQFQNLYAQLQELKESYHTKDEALASLLNKTSSFQHDILDARIINRDRWIGYNELKFRLVDPPMEITYTPNEGSIDKIFGLVKIDDGEYEIQAVKE